MAYAFTVEMAKEKAPVTGEAYSETGWAKVTDMICEASTKFNLQVEKQHSALSEPACSLTGEELF